MTARPDSIALSMLPPAPRGSVVKTRTIPHTPYTQWYFSGGYFKPGGKADEAHLIKSAVLSFDVDGKENPHVQMALGFDATEDPDAVKVIKQALYALPEDEARDLLASENVLEDALGQCAEMGLPTEPNRIIYTGHGYQLLWWMPDDMGGLAGEWANPRLKELLKRAVNGGLLPCIDAGAIDLGTRIIPIPGYQHRATGKRVTVEGNPHDIIADLKPFFENLAELHPQPVKVKRKSTKRKGKSNGPVQGGWSKARWDDSYPVLAIGERGPCPLCGRSGYRRLNKEGYTCFSCHTQFRIPPKVFEPVDGVRMIALDGKGYMILPTDRPDYLVLKTATGSGKTRLLAAIAKAHKCRWNFAKKVAGISPYKSLTEQLSLRLLIEHATAGGEMSLSQDSCALTLAALASKGDITRKKDLKHLCLVVDEIEAVLGQLGSMLKGRKANEAYNALLRLCLYAQCVVLCDQNAGAGTARFIKDLNAMREAAGLETRAFEWWVSDHYRHTFHFVRPVSHTNAQGEQVTDESSEAVHKGLIIEQLKAGKRVAGWMFGHTDARAFVEQLRSLFPTKTFRCVVGVKSRESENDLSESSLLVDGLFYNNAMSTGVSIDTEGWYDHRHIMCGNNVSVSGDMVEQAAHRVRNPVEPQVYISGSERTVIAASDWRCTAAGQLRRARSLFEADEAVAKHIKKDAAFTLASDYAVSADAQRLAMIQAEVVAASFTRGRGYPLPYLRTRHTFVDINPGVTNPDVATAHRDAVRALKDADALDIALAIPLGEAQLEEVAARGAETDDEADAASAARMEQHYGAAYMGLATVDEKKELVKAHKKGLYRQAEVFAQWRCLLVSDDAEASVDRLKSELTNHTNMTATFRLSQAVLLTAILKALEAERVAGEPEIAVTVPTALKVVEAGRPFAKMAGLQMRDDWRLNPRKQLATWLKLGGLKMTVRRGPRPQGGGQRERFYFLTDASLNRMLALSEKKYTDFTETLGQAPAPDLDDWCF